MDKILIVGGTSDLAIDFINNLQHVSVITLIIRNRRKFKDNYKPIVSHHLNYVTCDLSKLSAVDKLNYIDLNFFDKIVVFAGIDIIKPFKSLLMDEIINVFNVNIISTIILIKNLFKYKKISDGASFVFLNSISGTTKGSLGHTLYSSTKSAISGLTMSLALEYSKKNVRFNSISSGLVKTKNLYNKNKNIMSEKMILDYKKTYPLGFGEPEDIRSMISFLLSKKSKWITGQNIIIDGGNSIF